MTGWNRSSLAWGAVFCTVGLAYLLEEVGVWEVQLGVLLPLLLVVGGVVLAVSALLPDSRADQR